MGNAVDTKLTNALVDLAAKELPSGLFGNRLLKPLKCGGKLLGVTA
jgi:hypothetical protein